MKRNPARTESFRRAGQALNSQALFL